jgi:hypothetical protein
MTPYHYTVKAHLESIIADKVIRLASTGGDAGERLGAWFSTNPLWENTVSKACWTGLWLSLKDHYELSQGREALVVDEGTGTARIEFVVAPEFQPARIAVDAAVCPYTWNDYKRLSGVSKKIARGLYEGALAHGAHPGEWRVSFEPVPSDKWLALEVYDGKTWVQFKEGAH